MQRRASSVRIGAAVRPRPALLVLLFPLLAFGGWLLWQSSTSRPAPPAPSRGGTLVATLRAEPRSLNRLISVDRASQVVSLLTHARLVRINLASQEVEPALAESWTISEDGRTYTFRLRDGITFSDGAPFTADDVAFTFGVVLDEKVGSPLAGALLVNGEPPVVSVVDPRTVTVAFGGPFAPALRVLDSIPIFPAHRLSKAHQSGAFRKAWSVTTPPAEIAGLGPFVLREYVAGQRVELARNERYWKRDAMGEALPYLDRITLLIVPDQNAEMLKLESGEADLLSSEARPEDIAALRRAADARRLQAVEAGVGLDPDFLWFNLRPGAVKPARAWLQAPELREAISLAVDRQAFVDVVYLGAGVPIAGPITPGNLKWFDASRPLPPHDPARAAQLLEGLGLTDRNGDGIREARDGQPAQFALLTQKGNAVRERGAAFLQRELAKIGLRADLVTFDAGTVIGRVTAGDYEAAWFGVVASDTDPGTQLDFWTSRGAFHLWNPNQTAPATPWEQRIDTLAQEFVGTTDETARRRAFAAMLDEFDAARPVLYFGAPIVVVPMSARVTRARPALLQPSVLWDAERLQVRETTPR